MLHYRIMRHDPKPTIGIQIIRARRIIEDYQLQAKSRKREVSYPRHYMAYYLHRVLLLSCTLCAELLGRDHATILHSCKVYENYENDKYFNDIIKDFRVELIKLMNTLEC